MHNSLRSVLFLFILAVAPAVSAGDSAMRYRVSANASLASSDVYSLEGAFHYMVSPYFGAGGAVGYWSNYYETGWAAGDDWNIDEDDNKPSNFYLRPSVIIKSPALRIKATQLALYAEPSVMLNIPYQRVRIEKTNRWPVIEYKYASTSKGQWFAAQLRVGITAQIDAISVTAGYLMSNLDIYSQYRHLKFHGESFEQFYPKKSFMQGAFISLSYNF